AHAIEDSSLSGCFQHDSNGALRIHDQLHNRKMITGVNDASDDAFGSDNSRIGPQSVHGPLVDCDGLTACRIAADYSCDDGFTDVRVGHARESPNALRLENLLLLLHQLHPE